jgi:sialic acid synthase SpsE
MIEKLHKQIQIANRIIGDGYPAYVIAEMACAHNGSFEDAKALIKASAEAGADATQLQFFNMQHVVTPTNDLYSTLNNICFTEDQWSELNDYARSLKIDVWACTYDTPSVELAIKLKVDGIKLNSADLSNPEVVKAVAKSGIPFTLGTGASTLEEIRAGLQTAIENGAKDVILMHGVQNFPTQIEDLNISRLELLKQVFGIPAGYHDHVDGEEPFGKVVDLIAIGMGANVLEKHICLDRSKKGLDYQAALEPDEFKAYVERLKHAATAYGSKEPKPFGPSELKYRKFQKKSIISKIALKKGESLSRASVFFSRNNEVGIPPTEFPEMEGKKLKRDLDAFENISWEDLES